MIMFYDGINWRRASLQVLVTSLCLFVYLQSTAQNLSAGQNANEKSIRSNPFAGEASRRDAGEARFQQLCSVCHGAGGEGGQGEGHGPNLIDNPEIRRATDAGIFSIIHHGIPGTPMPQFALPDAQVWELVTFIRSLSTAAVDANVPGDWHNGEEIFFGKGKCDSCHMIRGRGGYLGNDLSNIGASAKVNELRSAITAPAQGFQDGFRPALLTTPDGQQVKVIIKHISNWSIQALDETGRLHLLSGPAMKQVRFADGSWMPNYSGKLTPEEIQNVIAFLARQTIQDQSTSEPSKARQAGLER